MPTADTIRTDQTEEPDFRQLFPGCDNAEIKAIQAWYASDFERRAAELSQSVRTEIAEELRAQFNSELEMKTAAMKQELEAEIAAAECDLEKKDAELANILRDEAFPYEAILRLRREKMEITSYLKGLKFRATTSSVRI